MFSLSAFLSYPPPHPRPLSLSLSLNTPIHTHRLQSLVPKYNLIIASYDIVRNDIDFFKYVSITL